MTMPATQPQNGRVKRGDYRREAVGGFPRWVGSFLKGLRALPEPGPDLARDLGPKIYDRMMLNSTISSCIRINSLGAISQGDHLSPVVTEKDHPDFDLAQEVTAYCVWCLDGIRPQKTDVYLDMLKAMAHGHRKAEKVYRDPLPGELQQFPGLKRALVLKSLKPKPNSALRFKVDEFLNIHWYEPYPSVQMGTAAETEAANRIDPAKIALLSWMPIDSDPRGSTALLDSAYPDFWDYEMARGELFKFIAQTAGPGFLARIREGAAPPEGTTDPVTGEYVAPLSRAQAVKAELEKWQSGSVGAFEDIEEFVIVEMKGEGTVFLDAMRHSCERMREATTLQSMAGSQAPNGTQALGSVHQDMLGYTIGYAREALANCIKDDVLTELVILNYGEAARHLVPNISFTTGAPEDLSALLTALSRLGYSLHRSQFPAIDGENGFPPRADNWMEDAPVPVVPPPGQDPNADPQGMNL